MVGRTIALAAAGILALAPRPLRAQERAPTTGPQQGTIAHTWKPVRRGGDNVVAIEVRTTLDSLPDSTARAFSLTVPITYAGVTGIAERTKQLTVRDATGDVVFRIEDDAPVAGGFPYYRHYRAERSVRFPVVVTYEAIAPATPLRAPPFGLYAAYGGVSGAGSGFVVLPEGELNVTTRVHWDLSDLAAGATATTSYGDGDFEIHGAPVDVTQGWIMAGPLGRYPATPGSSGFSAVWLGTPSFDAAAEMAWAARMYEFLGKSYGYLRPLPNYRVFIRVGGRGGTALGSSFMAGATPREPGAAATGEAPRETFTHEMGHLFVGGIDAPQGVQSWFSEGLNTYYTRLLPMRGGFTSVEEYGRAINADFDAYWYGSARNFSADSITRIGFGDEAVRHMPYVRSSLYFADLDSRIRARSHGRRTLDEVMRELFERRARGEHFDHAMWKETVAREVGETASAQFDSLIIRGTSTLVPASDAFGPCFERRATPARIESGVTRPGGYRWVRRAAVPDSTCRNWGESVIPKRIAERRPASASTRHVGMFGGTRVPYTATVEEQLLRDARGRAEASLVTIAYTRDDVADRTKRPVTFVFNGGPGSSSSPLHMSGLGPRLTDGDSTRANPESILDATDLVFIDPIGTGFSRPFTTEIGRRNYWTRSGDATSVVQAIEGWLKAHGRERSPRYLAGESYGTVRAGVILRDHAQLRFDGVILVAVVAGALTADDGEDSDAAFVNSLPTMAAGAWYHKAGPAGVASVEDAFAEGARFADGDYRATLAAGDKLDAATRDRVAARLASLLGVPVAFVLDHRLRLSKDDWMLQVLAAKGERTGMLDTRVVAKRDPARTGGLNDPSFNGGRMRFGTAMLAPSLLPGEAPAPPANPPTVLHRYLTRDLRFPTLETYRSLNLDINIVWDHEDGADVNPAVAAALRANPSMRLFWTGGYYDLTTPAHAVERAFAAAGMPGAQVTGAIVPAAHSVFADQEPRRLLAERLRTWIH